MRRFFFWSHFFIRKHRENQCWASLFHPVSISVSCFVLFPNDWRPACLPNLYKCNNLSMINFQWLNFQPIVILLIKNKDIAHWAFYYIMVHKKSKNLKNGHFLQSRTKIVLIEIKFAKFWYIGGWCAPVCLIDTLKNLVFYSKVTIKGGVKQVSKKLNLCRFSSLMTVFT